MLFLDTSDGISYIDVNPLVHNVWDSNYCPHYFNATMQISTSYTLEVLKKQDQAKKILTHKQ